jgi:ribose 5-phosphate isomerase RpiB
MNKIYIGNDHAALEYKTIILDYIKKKGFEVYD